MHSYCSSNDILRFQPQYPMLLCFYSWLCCCVATISGIKPVMFGVTTSPANHHLHRLHQLEPSPEGAGAAFNRGFKSRPPAQESQTTSTTERGLITPSTRTG